eukprot:763161-Hanusia_phi.AAC.3
MSTVGLIVYDTVRSVRDSQHDLLHSYISISYQGCESWLHLHMLICVAEATSQCDSRQKYHYTFSILTPETQQHNLATASSDKESQLSRQFWNGGSTWLSGKGNSEFHEVSKGSWREARRASLLRPLVLSGRDREKFTPTH